MIKPAIWGLIILLLSCTSAAKKKVKPPIVNRAKHTVIYIQPFVDYPQSRIDIVNKELILFYRIKTKVLPYKRIYEFARLHGTMRFSADRILDDLSKKIKEPSEKILGLTSYDIYTPKEVQGVNYPYWGIFGLGMKPGKSCVVSDFRLNQFGNRTNEFLINVVLHEIGHTFGLEHCDKNKRCLMSDAKGSGKTLFNEEKWLCPNCRKLLQKSKSYFPM